MPRHPKAKPIRMWAVTHPARGWYWSIAPTRTASQADFIRDGVHRWPIWYRRGFRCVRVEVRRVEP